MKIRELLCTGIAMALSANVCVASTVIYTNKAAFLSDTGAASNGAWPDIGIVSGGTVNIGAVTLSAVGGNHFFVGTAGTAISDWSPVLPGNDIAISGVENLDVSNFGLIYSFGFDMVEPTTPATCRVASCVDSTFTLSLFDGATFVDQISFNAPNDVAAFVGVWSTVAFDNVQIREITNNIDDEYFGPMYLGAASPVPVPAAAWLFGGALGALGVLRRKTLS